MKGHSLALSARRPIQSKLPYSLQLVKRTSRGLSSSRGLGHRPFLAHCLHRRSAGIPDIAASCGSTNGLLLHCSCRRRHASPLQILAFLAKISLALLQLLECA